MKTISVSEAKASLSEQLRYLRQGGQVLITHRGTPVARLVPVDSHDDLSELESSGLVRSAMENLPRGFWSLPRPVDRSAGLRAALENERENTW